MLPWRLLHILRLANTVSRTAFSRQYSLNTNTKRFPGHLYENIAHRREYKWSSSPFYHYREYPRFNCWYEFKGRMTNRGWDSDLHSWLSNLRPPAENLPRHIEGLCEWCQKSDLQEQVALEKTWLWNLQQFWSWCGAILYLFEGRDRGFWVFRSYNGVTNFLKRMNLGHINILCHGG